MKKIAIYARVSTSNGSQDYQRQINDLKRLILSHGYTEEQIEIFAESVSGYKKNSERPELNRLLRIIEEDNQYFEIIYVTELSRLGREPGETRRTIDIMTDFGLPIYIQSLGRSTLDKDGKRDTIMNIILQVLLEFANAEAEQMKNRSRSGLLNSAKAGKAGGGKHVPYGYSKDENKMLVINEEEAEIIKLIFNLYMQGNGVKVISGILNERSIPTRYNKAYAGKQINFSVTKDADKIKWSDKTVLDIITNTLYIGKRNFKGHVLEAPRIISDDVFDKCEQIRTTKTHRNNLTTYTYLFKDIIKCGCCGRNYFGRYKPVVNGDKVYLCSSSLKTGERCQNKGINIQLIETAVYNELCSSPSVLKYLSRTKEIKKSIEQNILVLESQLNAEQNLLPSKMASKKRLLDLLLSDIISEADYKEKDSLFAKQIKNIEKKIIVLKKDLKEKKLLLEKQTDIGTSKAMLLDAAHNRAELQAIFQQIIHKVTINNLSSQFTLATVYVQLNGVVLQVPLKILIDKSSIRKRIVRYASFNALENEPVFQDNRLILDAGEALSEMMNTLYEKDWIIVDELLEVEIKKPVAQVA